MNPQLDARAKAIFDEVFDLDPRSREKAVVERAAGDMALLARVRALVAACDRDGAFLNDPTRIDDPRLATGTHAISHERPGDQIGPYTLLEQLGEGGFGTVFLAEQARPLRRRVAIKIVKLGMDTRAVIARFEQERQALAMMGHPGIAKVLDAGATASGRPYFVMELVDGRAITSYCDQQTLGVRERLGLFVQVCQAVQHAHGKGVIHRDIKPSNVLVSERDGQPSASVIDFGIAKATQQPLTDKTVFTELRQLIGTPEYMSPEQAEGGLDIDTRTDVYSLGVLLYELLCGQTPLDAKQLRSAAFDELRRQIREVEPPAPSTRLSTMAEQGTQVAANRRTEPRRLSSLLHGELDWIVMRAIDKDRNRRYSSAAALAEDIERYLAGKEVEAAPPSVSYRVSKFARRNVGVVLTVGVVVGALATGLGIALWQSRVAASERDLARAAQARAVAAQKEADARTADLAKVAEFQAAQFRGLDVAAMGEGISKDLIARAVTSTSKAGDSSADSTAELAAFRKTLARVNATDIARDAVDAQLLERSATAISKEFADQPTVRAGLLTTLAETSEALGLRERAKVAITEALDIRRKLLGDDHHDTIQTVHTLANIDGRLGDRAMAVRLLRDCLERNTRLYGAEHPDTLKSMDALAVHLTEGDEFDEAEKLILRTIEIGSRNGTMTPAKLAGRENTLGMLYTQRRRLADGERLLASAVDRLKGLPGEELDLMKMSTNLAGVRMMLNKNSEAEAIFRDNLAKQHTLLGDDNPETLRTMAGLGVVLERQGKINEAIEVALDRLQRSRTSLKNDHPQTLNAMANAGKVLMSAKRYSEAEPLFREAWERHKTARGEAVATTQEAAVLLAGALRGQEKYDDALALLRPALVSILALRGKDHQETSRAHVEIGTILLELRRFAEAEPELLEGHRGALAVPGIPPMHIDRVTTELAKLYEEWNTAAPSAELAKKATDWNAKAEARHPKASNVKDH